MLLFLLNLLYQIFRLLYITNLHFDKVLQMHQNTNLIYKIFIGVKVNFISTKKRQNSDYYTILTFSLNKIIDY